MRKYQEAVKIREILEKSQKDVKIPKMLKNAQKFRKNVHFWEKSRGTAQKSDGKLPSCSLQHLPSGRVDPLRPDAAGTGQGTVPNPRKAHAILLPCAEGEPYPKRWFKVNVPGQQASAVSGGGGGSHTRAHWRRRRLAGTPTQPSQHKKRRFLYTPQRNGGSSSSGTRPHPQNAPTTRSCTSPSPDTLRGLAEHQKRPNLNKIHRMRKYRNKTWSVD